MIHAKDLKPTEYFFTYYPGAWSRGHGDAVEYRHPSITVSRVYGGGGFYAATVFCLKGQTHRDAQEGERPAYAWDLDVRLADAQDPALSRFLACLKKVGARYYSREIRGIVRALAMAKIPRYVHAHAEDTKVPRRYKGNGSEFAAARKLVRA